MRQTIRALGWIIAILWICTLLLPITVAFSLIKLFESKAVGVQEPTVSFSNGNFSMSAPFHINNTGFYDLSDIGISIQIGRKNKTISTSSRLLPNVPAGTMVNSSCDISVSLEEMVSKDRELLINDTDLNVSVSPRFRVAYIIAFGFSMSFAVQWGAPFYNLTISDVAYDNVSQKFSMWVSFDNHAVYPVNGSLLVMLYNDIGEHIGSATQDVNVPSETPFQTFFELTIDRLKMTRNGVVRLYFGGTQILEKEWELS